MAAADVCVISLAVSGLLHPQPHSVTVPRDLPVEVVLQAVVAVREAADSAWVTPSALSESWPALTHTCTKVFFLPAVSAVNEDKRERGLPRHRVDYGISGRWLDGQDGQDSPIPR